MRLINVAALMQDGILNILTLSKRDPTNYFPAISSVAITPRVQWGTRKIVMPIILFITNFVATIYIGMAFM